MFTAALFLTALLTRCMVLLSYSLFFFFFQAEDGIRDFHVTGVQTCALPILVPAAHDPRRGTGEQRGVTPREEQRGRIGDRAQQRRQRRVLGKQHGGTEAIQLVEDLMARLRRAGADGGGGRAAESRECREGAVRSAQGRRRGLEGGDEGAQPRGPDPRDLRERQIRGYLVATPARSACHSVSMSSGSPSRVTDETATTGAPPVVRIAGSSERGAGSRSSLVSTTICGFDASSGE